MITRSPHLKKFRRLELYHIFLFLAFMAIFSVLGLDYIALKKGERAYFFSLSPAKKELPSEENLLVESVHRSLSMLGLSPEAIKETRDENKILNLAVDIPLREYAELETLLDGELARLQAAVLKEKEQEDKERVFFFWRVTGKKRGRLTISFICEKEKVEMKKEPTRPPLPNKVAIVIDDMGYSLETIRELCALNKPLTVAVLPFSPLARETARLAHENGLEVILHLPLESLNDHDSNNESWGIIHSRMSEEEVRKTVEDSLDQVPFIKGVNNHMGSKITEDRIIMGTILEAVRRRNLYFLDSRTSGKSIAYELAREMGIPAAYRHVFLDTVNNEDSIKASLVELFRLAQKQGAAVGIGHPFDETLKVLKTNISLLEKDNLKPVFASQVLTR